MAASAPGEARTFTASDGAALCYSVTPSATTPQVGVAVLLHGARSRRCAASTHGGMSPLTPAADARRWRTGWSGSRRYWDAVVPLLAAAGLCVVAPDLRWHGDSAAGSPAGGPCHVARLGADLSELLAACEETRAAQRVLLVGSSMGASVAWHAPRSRSCCPASR